MGWWEKCGRDMEEIEMWEKQREVENAWDPTDRFKASNLTV